MESYFKIQQNLPAYAVIISNQNFDDKDDNRDGADKDIDKLKELDRQLNIKFKHILTDLTADEMKGALKFLATRNSNDLKNKEEAKGALKLLPDSEKKVKKCTTLENFQLALNLLYDEDDSSEFEGYSCFMVFISTHGSNDGILKGRDSNTDKYTTVEELAKYFDSKQCKALAGKPKMFFIQACRGKNVMEVDTSQGNDKSNFGM